MLDGIFSSKPLKHTVKKKDLYFSISFVGKRSFALRNKLSKLFREFYPQVNLHVIFKTGRTVQSLFRCKDKVPDELQSSVVYKYECHCCNAMYIGKTKRQLRVRIHEHLGRSVRTNRPLTNPSFSAIREHSLGADHPILMSSFTVLSSQPSDRELCISESLLTIKFKPSLVNNEKSMELLCY